VEVHLAGNLHYGEAAQATGGVTSGLIGLHDQVTWRAKHFWVWHELTSEITTMDRPAFFRDLMVRGIFKSMTHDHFFRELSSGQTEMTDVFSFAAPLGILGIIAEVLVLRRYMRKLLRERNSVLLGIAESNTVTTGCQRNPSIPE
jgi:ligand-binding SRPBCC domain-containing protein